MKLLISSFIPLLWWIYCYFLVVHFCFDNAKAIEETKELLSPETLFRQTVSLWRSRSSSASKKKRNEWLPWYDFSEQLQTRFFSFDNANNDNNNNNNNNMIATARLEIVGAMEEGILMIERSSMENQNYHSQQQQQHQHQQQKEEEKTLSLLYGTYGNLLMHLTPQECLSLAMDPHTLLIGVEQIKATPPNERIPDTFLCRENAENALRNAMTLDATNQKAEELFQQLLSLQQQGTDVSGGAGGGGTIHKRKPKEFVAELFDSFADTFDDKLLKTLEYRVPEMVGMLAKSLVKYHIRQEYRTVLDAGCGTGLAGRYLRPIMEQSSLSSLSEGEEEKQPQVLLIGVDASQKMLNKAALCTIESGCGLPVKKGKQDEDATSSRLLYDALLNMDLEDMNLSNTLYMTRETNDTDKQATISSSSSSSYSSSLPDGFDLIVAADVLVYFGSLESIFQTFSNIATKDDGESSSSSHLIFSCELATEEEAPLGWRLLPSGRFAHTKQHAIDMAYKAGYTKLLHYEEIVPRMEKGVPVRGHLFGFGKQIQSTKDEQDRITGGDNEL